MSLVDEAKKLNLKRIRKNNNVTKEQIDLLFAYLKNEITMVQMMKVLFNNKIITNKTNCAAWFFRVTETAYNRGYIKLLEGKD